jgi:hypothetical protein
MDSNVLRATPLSDVTINAQVKLVDVKFREEGADNWRNTQIISNPNMSWCSVPDALHVRKYSSFQITSPELIDFVWGPVPIELSTGESALGFTIRIDPTHTGAKAYFYELGTYKVIVQVSAADMKAERITLFVEWNGGLKIKSETGEILEAFSDEEEENHGAV